MKSYRTLALKELLSQKVTSILILIAVVLSTMMTTIVGQSIGVLSAMREQQAIAIGGNRYATFLQMNADQLHALEQDEHLSYVGKSIYMGSLELSPSLTLGLMEYWDDTAAIYPSSTSVEEGRLPEAPMEIALSEDILKYLGFEGGIGDKITLSLQKNLRHNIADSYSYTAEFVLTGILKNNYLGYTSGTVTGVVGEGTAEQLLTESYIYYNVDIRTADKKNFQAVVDDINNKGRTAITILSLVMSITVFIALQGFSSLLNAASALQDNHVGDYQITNESIGFTTDDLNTLRKNEAVQSVAAIQFSLYEQNENGLLDEISLEFQLKPGETFQVVGLNDEYWDYFMGDQLPEEQLGQLKSGNACIVRNPIPMSYGEDVLEFTNIEAGENICVAGMELNVLKTLDGYDGYLGIGNGGFTNGVQVIVDDAIYERLTGKDTYSEFLPTLNEGADRENFDTFIEAFCNRIPGTTFLSYEETDQQLKESFAQIQMLAWGLILFVGLIGILNIINTVYTNIHTRVTEIGMQRAIGMSADSLYKTFLWEGAYYGIIASVIGSVLGYVCTIFIEAATSDTIQLVAIPVMPILEATLLAVGACLLATAIPLRKISKMSIVDSIETVE